MGNKLQKKSNKDTPDEFPLCIVNEGNIYKMGDGFNDINCYTIYIDDEPSFNKMKVKPRSKE